MAATVEEEGEKKKSDKGDTEHDTCNDEVF